MPQAILDKLVVVPGDLLQPGLGLSEQDEKRFLEEVHFVIHSAASVSFFEHVHTLLDQNYEVRTRVMRRCTTCLVRAVVCSSLVTLLDACTARHSLEDLLQCRDGSLSLQATKKVALLAQRMKQLKGFVHASTAYVNANLPKGSHVEEKIYPIYRKNGQILDPDGMARTLAALSPAAAEAKVQRELVLTAVTIFTCVTVSLHDVLLQSVKVPQLRWR